MPVKSTVLGPGKLLIGDVSTTTAEREFATQCTKARLKPSTKSDDALVVLSGDSIPGSQTTTWELEATLIQDYDTDNLAEWCMKHAGKQVPFKFTPNGAAKRMYSGELVLRPIDIGGDVTKRNTSDVVFPLVGDPVPGDAE